jgi:hypothetical protein
MARVAWVEDLGRLHRRTGLLASFIRHAGIPIRLGTESGKLRRLQRFGAARFGRIDRRIQEVTSRLNTICTFATFDS